MCTSLSSRKPSGLSSGKVVASAFFTDGTTKDITVKEAYIGSGMTSSKNVILGGSTAPYTTNAGWYTYSVNSSDEYSLYKYESKYTPASYSFSGNNTVVTENNKVSFLNGQSVYANDSTIVIVNDNDDEVTVYTGVKNLPDIKLTSANSTADVKVLARSNHYAYYVYIDVNGSASISGGEDTKLVYFVEFDGQYRGTDNEIYYTYTTLDGTAEKDVVADSQVAGSGPIYAAYYKTRTNGDGAADQCDGCSRPRWQVLLRLQHHRHHLQRRRADPGRHRLHHGRQVHHHPGDRRRGSGR